MHSLSLEVIWSRLCRRLVLSVVVTRGVRSEAGAAVGACVERVPLCFAFVGDTTTNSNSAGRLHCSSLDNNSSIDYCCCTAAYLLPTMCVCMSQLRVGLCTYVRMYVVKVLPTVVDAAVFKKGVWYTSSTNITEELGLTRTFALCTTTLPQPKYTPTLRT